MTARTPDSLERLSHADLIGVVRELIGEVGRLRAENEKLGFALKELKAEHQAVKDELARLKNLPPRPPQKPSGMDKATDRGGSGSSDKSPAGEKSSRRRGSQLDKLTIGATVVVTAKAPAGSRRKGYEEIVVQDLSLSPQVTLYRRERWETPEGERIIAELDPGIVGGYGPNLHRFVLALHFSGQVTCERIVALLHGMGVRISKRQVVRLLTVKLETFRAEDAAVLKAGLGGAYVTVDDTGARHAGKSGYTTQIGSNTFTVFRTGPSKSREAFLSRLCGSTTLYVINDAALGYMKDRQLPQAVIDKFADHKERIFSRPENWERHLQALGLTDLKVTPDPVLIASEAALWGAIRHQGLLQDTPVRPGRQSYRAVRLSLLEPAELPVLGVSATSGQPDANQIKRGTVLSRRWVGNRAPAVVDGMTAKLIVQREPDQGTTIDDAVPFGLAVTLSMPGVVELYDQARLRLRLPEKIRGR